jgi:hypothetical protein
MSESYTNMNKPGIHIGTAGDLYLYADGEYELTTMSHKTTTTWGYHHSVSMGDTLSGYAAARQTWVAGSDTTMKAGVDVTAKVAADISLFLGPKVEAAATVGKVAATKSIVSAAHNHTFGEAAALGAVSDRVAAMEQRCSAATMAAIGESVRSVGDAVSVMAAVSTVVAQETHVANMDTALTTMSNKVVNMSTTVAAMVNII